MTSRTRWRAPVAAQLRARQLRREMTPAEARLWQRIRARQVDGAFFRKQHAVGPFVVDFFCAKSKLVIEIDGDTHVSQAEYDAERTRWLSSKKNYRVLRFTNRDVLYNIEGVLETIAGALRE